MNKQSAEDYLDKLLNSISGESTEEKKTVEVKPAKKEPMYSRGVTKSEAEFLKEFEAELAADDFLKSFDDDLNEPEDKMTVGDFGVQEEEDSNPLDVFTKMDIAQEQSVAKEENPLDSFSIDGVDLGALLNEATEGETVPTMTEPVSTSEPVPFSEDDLAFMDIFQPEKPAVPVEESVQDEGAPLGDGTMEDIFANLFGDAAGGDGEMDTPLGESSEGIDLSNLGEADLMSLLAGEDGLSDIGNMLTEDGAASMGDEDAFAMFAEGEMAAQAIEEADEDDGSKKKKKKKKKKEKKKKENGEAKGGFLGKLSGILNALMDDDEEDEEIELKRPSAPTVEQLSGENAEILAAFQNIEDRPEKKDKDKKKKEKKKKEKKDKDKKKKEKAKKEKKPKKPKEPKPKKEKKPKEKDNTPPLPRGPVIVIWVMAISLFALVMLGVNLSGYSSSVSAAKEYHNNGEYAKAYAELLGLEIKEKDTLLYNQVATLAAVDSELNAFDAFLLADKHQEALDSLVCAAGRCEVNAKNAEMYECQGQMQILQAEVTNKLYANYGMTYEEALEIYNLGDRDDYSIALVQKLRSLGIVVE